MNMKGGVRVPKGGRGSVVERWRLKSVALRSIPGGCPDFFSSSYTVALGCRWGDACLWCSSTVRLLSTQGSVML